MAGWPHAVRAEMPQATYVFPAGAQRGTKCQARIGGLFLHENVQVELFGSSIDVQSRLKEIPTIWFENPLMAIPAGTGGDDRTRDFQTEWDIPAHAELETCRWRLWNSQGATNSLAFVIGDLPEVIENEIPGRPIAEVVAAPVTVNGRIFPSEDVDLWQFSARRGEMLTVSLCAAEIGSPLRARMQLYDPGGTRLGIAHGSESRDPRLTFRAEQDGLYEVRLDDIRLAHTTADGGYRRPAPQSYVYRLTIAPQWNVTHFFPLGGRRGTILQATLYDDRNDGMNADITIPATATVSHTQRVVSGPGKSRPLTFDVGDLNEFLEHEPNDDNGQAPVIRWPAVANGQIGRPGDVDLFALEMQQGQICDLDLRATRLNSQLNAVLAVIDDGGRELIRDESLQDAENDPSLRFTAPHTGKFLVRVSSRLISRGGSAFAYRLHVIMPHADFGISLPRVSVTVLRPVKEPVSGEKSERPKLVVPAESKLAVLLDSPGPLPVPLMLSIAGLPAGVTVTGTEIPAGAKQTELVFTAEHDATIQSTRLRITGNCELDGQVVEKQAFCQQRWGQPPIEHVRLAVAIATPFRIRGATDYCRVPRGTIVNWQYELDRFEFDGPITVQLSDRQPRILEGMTGPILQVPSKATSFIYPAQLGSWMALDRAARAAVMGFATITDFDGTSHTVHYSAEDPRSQIYMLVVGGPLSLEALSPTLDARSGTTVPIKVRVIRQAGLQTAVRLTIEPPTHIEGVTADPVIVPAESNEGELRLRFSAPLGPFNMPVTIRGTAIDSPLQYTAETQFEPVAAP